MATKRESCAVLDDRFVSFYRSLGRLGLRLANLYASGQHRKLVSVTVNPEGYSDWRDFYADYAAVAFLKKYPGLKTGINTRDVALRKFEESETLCCETNHRLLWIHKTDPSLFNLLERARGIVQSILGDFSWDATLPYLSHGPGATFGTKKDRGHPVYKFGDITPTTTGETLALDACFIEYASALKRYRATNGVDLKIVAGSKIATVPKDARSDRVIAIEPLLNMFYQKGIGGLMRSRLARAGCDLNDQTCNQTLASLGSIDGSWATLDLASASDSVSRQLVELLLPDDWLVAMKTVRSSYTRLPSGEWKFLQKFSSMGNGYTFELESLIFLALGRAVAKLLTGEASGVSVYGDDICLHPELVSAYVHLLEVCGFKTNEEKSFVKGPFRESCGKHFFRGHDVTPLYVKSDINSVERILWFANSVKRFAHRFLGMGYGLHGSFRELWVLIQSSLDRRYSKLTIPDGYGDGGLIVDFDEKSPSTVVSQRGLEGFIVRAVVRQYGSFPLSGGAALVYSLHELEKRRGAVIAAEERRLPSQRYKLRAVRLLVTRWPVLGPWVNGL